MYDRRYGQQRPPTPIQRPLSHGGLMRVPSWLLSRLAKMAAVVVASLALLVVFAHARNAASSGAAYVDRDSIGGECSDARSYDGARSTATPWCSLGRAVEASPGGAEIRIRAGTYPPLAIKGGPSRSDYLTFRAHPGERPSTSLILKNTSYLSVEGLRLDSAWITSAHHVRLRANEITPHGVVVRRGSFLDFESNYFHDIALSKNPTLGGYALRLVTGPVSDVRVVDNVFDRITSDALQAGSTTRILIEGNEIARANAWDDPTEHSDAIQFYGTVTDATIRRNWLHHNNHSMIAKGHTYAGLVIENNLVHDTASGLNLYDTPGARIINNTIWAVRAFGLRLSQIKGHMGDVMLANNIIQKSWAGSTHLAVDVANQINGDPLFLADYELSADSPAVDSGSTVHAPSTDRLGRSRSAPDIGAHERPTGSKSRG